MEDRLRCRRKDGWMCKNGVVKYDREDYVVCQALVDTKFVRKDHTEYLCPFFVRRKAGEDNEEE